MPIIEVRFIRDAVAGPEQKRQLIERLTEIFVRQSYRHPVPLRLS